MARSTTAPPQVIRRDEFVDAAQRLIQAKGYERMSVQDIQDEVGASRGGFYHHFDSKQALLDAVVARMVDATTATLEPVVADPTLAALAKLQHVFSGIADWKAERRELVLSLARVWLSDDNALVREKLRQHLMLRLAPLLAAIIRQGRAEGLFTATSPDETARVLISLIHGANQVATELFIARQSAAASFDAVERTLTAYSEAYERVLGVPVGSLSIDPAILRLWFE
ncbi:MAG: TetR/AcrR family transcriptional regulator [Candidatus Dormiibacterota bacterium]